MTMIAQFNIPIHPACVPLSDSQIEQGKVAIAKCRSLFAKYCISTNRQNLTGIAEKHIMEVAPLKTALERSSLISDAADLRHQEQQLQTIYKKRNMSISYDY